MKRFCDAVMEYDDFQDLIAGTFNPGTLQDKPARVIRVFLSCTATGKFTRRAVLSCTASRVVHVRSGSPGFV